MNAITQQTATTGQIKQINRFGSDAIEKVLGELGLDNPGAQRVIEHGDEFAEAVRTAALASLKDLSVSDKFKDEEVDSKYGYLSGYTKPKGITEQTQILSQIFPGVGNALEKLAERAVPANAEGWFAIPKWQTIAPTYSEAVQKVLDAIKKSRNGKFYNYRDSQINEERLRQTAKTASVFQKLGNEQKDHDILVVAAQFGIRHRGRSVRRAREVFVTNEFGLGAFAIGIMILTHAERLQHYDDLWIDCAGDEFDDPGSGVRFDRAPCFRWSDGEVKFDTDWYGIASGNYGSASGFVPQE
ncbi:MAG: hypothetical protein A3G05_02415 [Candidatus Zambryskibacteria bacterium RIFCSPLOWO2_12_FULL_45_14]|uniref:Uncharacterized protein n=2 Tax=Candidatus Zambryskiibacteriota TaxID=1817925 RepID=A0A1G2UJW1_9BACT|nr:MAG: hypothetical protein A3H60_02375 [Candidatus Zambryskibacteria bacterium RIFCSPLOWO2_02_FULL_44_12b]OHB14563.1 MAG: hypothetical protein A3G05_02415 [Candidatus Zambryskibacteria bacterium RIFCSPLOWO2_12_FULL_45_14]